MSHALGSWQLGVAGQLTSSPRETVSLPHLVRLEVSARVPVVFFQDVPVTGATSTLSNDRR